jgi:uncharacterized membrane protein/mono/diheme cytochrome c family protein
MSLISHAGGSPIFPTWSVMVSYLHLIGVATWIGGLVVIALILRPTLLPLSPEARGQALLALIKRFSPVAVIAVSVIIFTGIYAASVTVYQPRDLADSTYGLTLIGKWILMLPLLGLGLLHHVVVHPQRWPPLAAKIRATERFLHLPQTLPLEAVFAALLILVGALLPATPPPDPATNAVDAPQTQTITVEGYTVTLTLGPGAVGTNSYDVMIQQADLPADITTVKLRLTNARYGEYTPPLLLEKSEAAMWIGANSDVARAATWQVLIDFTPTNGQPVRAVMQWEIAQEAPNGTPAPSWLNWLSAAGVILILGAWAVPPAYRSTAKLGWTPETTAIVVGAVGLALLVMIGGVLLIRSTSQELDEQRDAPAAFQNPILPDQAAVLAGKNLYEAQCLACHGAQGLPPADQNLAPLTEVLLRRDDDALYRILARGLAGQHLYGSDWSEEARWQLIHYLRGLEG